jgi:hypothetical protein
MPGITGMGTTFNLPNYVGELFQLTPDTTPLLSAIGGLTGGRVAKATKFEWQADDLRDARQRTRLEGADAPEFDGRQRIPVGNVVEIHQESVNVSYTKQSTPGQTTTAGVDPADQPVQNELNYQVAKKLKEIARDVEYSFIRGRYVAGDQVTPRQTRGLLEAIQTNVIDLSAATYTAAAVDGGGVITSNGHGLSNGDKLVLTDAGLTGFPTGRALYARDVTTNTFKVASANGGAALVPTAAGNVNGRAVSKVPTTPDTYDDLFHLVYDNGGLEDVSLQTLMVGSTQKRNISTAFANAYGKYSESSRNVGGVNFTTIVTDFGTVNLMLDRFMPADEIAAVSLEMLAPRFLEVPGKGHFFEEPLAKTGSSDRVQLYGEIGLEYGNELAHGRIKGLPLR